MWQDYVFAAGAIVFAVALLPAIRSNEKPPLTTSVPTFVVLYVFAFCFATLDLWYTTAMQLITAVLWTIIALQKYRQIKD